MGDEAAQAPKYQEQAHGEQESGLAALSCACRGQRPGNLRGRRGSVPQGSGAYPEGVETQDTRRGVSSATKSPGPRARGRFRLDKGSGVVNSLPQSIHPAQKVSNFSANGTLWRRAFWIDSDCAL